MEWEIDINFKKYTSRGTRYARRGLLFPYLDLEGPRDVVPLRGCRGVPPRGEGPARGRPPDRQVPIG